MDVYRKNQRAKLVWREWHGARPDEESTPAGDTYLCADNRPPYEGSTSPYFKSMLRDNDNLLQPENQHVKLNLDVKADNDPDRLFVLMRYIISKHADYDTLLAPRILIGLWHPRFIAPAKMQLPHCKLSYIGNCTDIARKYFWADCDTFSMSFGTLTTCEGRKCVSRTLI